MERTRLRSASLLPVFASFVLGACNSQPSSSPAAPAKQGAKASAAQSMAPEAKRLHDDVAWLADDAQEGRRAGTEAGKKAGDWLAARCKALGLKPAGGPGGSGRVSVAPTSFEVDSKKEIVATSSGDTNSYEQQFSVPKPVEVGTHSYVSWNVGSSSDHSEPVVLRESKQGEVMPVFCSSGGTVAGALEQRGYGIISGENNWNDYKTRCDGKVVLVMRGTPPRPATSESEAPPANPHGGNVEAGDGWGNSGSLFLKVMNAKKNGAVAVMIAPEPGHEDEPLPAFDYSRVAESGIPALFISAGIAKRLWFGGTAVSVDRAQPYGEAVTLSTGIEVSADIKRDKGPAYNVLGLLPGKDHSRTVVVGAHYDHLGHGGEGSLAPNAYGQIHNGADDNASGTATVLEIARVMSKGSPPECDVLFALWSGEELGLLGSEHWAQNPTIPLDRVVANLNLDMVGRAGNGSLEVLGVGSAEPFESWLKEASTTSQLTLKMNSSGQGIGGSDHQTFLKRKIPALFFFSGVHADYHKPSDDTERFEADGAQRVAALGVDIVRRMCSAKKLAFVEPPAPDPAAAAAQPRAGGQWRVWFGSVPEYSYQGPGLMLAGTSAGGPAEKAGLLKGDVILQVGDIVIEGMSDYMYMLQTYKPGDVVLARFLRDNKEESVRVTLATRDAQ